ncbi:MAG: phosphoribosylamine--glycine ligase, partial [Clostridiales bacterium]|nr:phosphoribosylamine--glycine ligase [Clostridiales bacterium]
ALARCIDIKATDLTRILDFVKEEKIDLTVVAPDDPLAMGLVDMLEDNGFRAFGPRKAAARIESSKVFAKKLMKKYGIPTADYASFNQYEDAIAFLKQVSYPVVIKADGLALGKGVIITDSKEKAEETIYDMMLGNKFGEAGKQILIEEYITGPEVSILVFIDGKTYIPMVSSQAHKRVFDNDEGPNTGGMGAFSPSPHYTPDVAAYVEQNIIELTIRAMEEEGRPFKGVLYFGLMLTADGPKVLEYNARFGDPETQVVLPRLKSDLLEIIEAIIDQRLGEIKIEWNDKAAACVVLASNGYPGSYEKGLPIKIGLDENEEDIFLFHAGTERIGEKLVTSGGRVLGLTALGNNLEDAVRRAYERIDCIYFKGMHYRRDIGRKF